MFQVQTPLPVNPVRKFVALFQKRQHSKKKGSLSNGVKFICGFIYTAENIYTLAKTDLLKKFGPVDFESPVIDFNFTDYYYPEMGRPLLRRFVSFKKLKNPGDFIKIKKTCLKVEKKYRREGKRRVNIDPGYINEAKLVLTTSKDFSHRIYLGRGVYAEVTLYFYNGKFCDFPTTFPDYRTGLYKGIFQSIRDIYRQNIRK